MFKMSFFFGITCILWIINCSVLTKYTIFGVSIIGIQQDTHTIIDDTPEIELIELIPHLLSCLVCTEFYLIAYFFNTYLHLSYLCTVFLFLNVGCV